MVPAEITYLELVAYLLASFVLGALACKIALNTLARARLERALHSASGEHAGLRAGVSPEPETLYKSKPWAAL